jgi:hypothetical protein
MSQIVPIATTNSMPTFHLQKRKPGTKNAPTWAMLSADKGPKVKVTVPLKTSGFGDNFQSIELGNTKYEPGQTYHLHPIQAEELQKSISNYERASFLQRNRANDAGIPLLPATGLDSVQPLAVLE